MPVVNVCVYGLSGQFLEDFFLQESTRRTQPLVASSPSGLRFGVVGGAASLGMWGRGWPMPLERCLCQRYPCRHVSPADAPSPDAASPPAAAATIRSNVDNFLVCDHYVAQVPLTDSEVTSYQASKAAGEASEAATESTAFFVLPCRLVILENAFYRVSLSTEKSISATPGTVIAAVDQQHSLPSVLHVTHVDGSTALSPQKDVAPVKSGASAAASWAGVLDIRLKELPLSATGEDKTKNDNIDVADAGAHRTGTAEGQTEPLTTVSFTSTSAHFGQLYNLPALPHRPLPSTLTKAVPSAAATGAATTLATLGFPAAVSDVPSMPAETHEALNDALPPFCDCGREGCDGASATDPGPLLSLTFYANDPRLPYDQNAWEAELTPEMAEVVQKCRRDEKERGPITTAYEVTDVRPIPVEGSCWCHSNLPMPAPLEQQLREVKRRRNVNGGPTPATTGGVPGSPNSSVSSPLVSPASPVSSAGGGTSPASSHHHSHRESSRRTTNAAAATPVGFLEKGWCVRPLTSVKAVVSQADNTDAHGRPPLNASRTQEIWTCLLNLRELEEYGIEVTIRVPYVVEGTVLRLKGTTVIFSGMLQSSTSGTVLLPVFCPAPEGTKTTELSSLWMKLYVQYLLVFPLTECDTARPLEVVRSCESYARLTVPTLIGHRGLGRTYTRSPAFGGKPQLIMKCNENTVNAFCAAYQRKCAMVEFDVMLSADRVPVVIHDPVIELLALTRGEASVPLRQPEHAPVRSHVHKMTFTQLRDLHAQCCKTLGRVFPLKDLLMHHWEGLVRWTALQKAPSLTGDSPPQVIANKKKRPTDPTIDSALLRGEDFPSGVPSLREVLEQTPPSLRFNLEIKYPFQPRWDANLFLQSDAFEVNGFVDAVLRLVFEFAKDGREITFSSFDPNICLALTLKQSRYDVFFLSDTKELRDLKDYRSFYVEGAMQFASAQHFSGISMNAGTLLSSEDEELLPHIPETNLHGTAAKGPVTAELFRGTEPSLVPGGAPVPSSFGTHGRAMIAEMHRRHLKVWTWGSMNDYLYFAYTQAAKMRVDGVIGDRLPVFEK